MDAVQKIKVDLFVHGNGVSKQVAVVLNFPSFKHMPMVPYTKAD